MATLPPPFTVIYIYIQLPLHHSATFTFISFVIMYLPWDHNIFNSI